MKLLLIMRGSESTECCRKIFSEEAFVIRCDQIEPDIKKIERDIKAIDQDYTHILVKSCSGNGRGERCLRFLLENFRGKIIETRCCGDRTLPDCLPFETPKILMYLRSLDSGEKGGLA